jgi:eukaryotic-like serine/threonine-protein kinase
MLAAGTVLDNRYRIGHPIGKGRLSRVYYAEEIPHTIGRQHDIRRQVAIKVIDPEDLDIDDQDIREVERLFMQEVQAIIKLNHPNIVPLLDYNETYIENRKLMYMVMPYHRERSLADWLDQHHAGNQQLSLAVVERIVRQAADALQYAHDHQIIHRDVKASNFLVQDDARALDGLHLQLADFGIARFITKPSKTHYVRGTTPYMAPEQWDGEATAATDQYALAVMAYELLTGRYPFVGSNTEQLWHQHKHMPPEPPGIFNANVPEALDEVLLTALEKRPEDRYSSISAFADAFHEAVAYDDKTHVPPVGPATPPPTGLPPPPIARVRYSSPAPPRQPLPIGNGAQLSHRGNPVPPGRHHSRRGGVTCLIGAIVAVLLIAACTIGPMLWSSIQQALEAPSATATAEVSFTATAAPNETSTAQTVNATRTAITQENATATAKAQATANIQAENPYPTYFSSSGPMQGKLALYDPMSDNSYGYNWLTNSSNGTSCSFQDGALHVSMNSYTATQQQIRFHICIAQASPTFSNFAYEIHMKIIAGECGGILFRSNNPKLYYFYICINGSYDLIRYISDTSLNPVLTTKHYTDFIKQSPNQDNTIAVVANESKIDLYVNGNMIDSVTDTVYRQGNIGVLAKREFAQTEVAFSNARVWTF